ncbi:MAG: quinolinate synthase [Lentisphaerae bacterium RIFOXYB12_FULL_65_16]|nr:MAG: quinolinate synthase [Lentisphaerae bacterium RIFOXYA12_64_32]OGV89156.1 MAG: quinolinate synthase [Lentisphaerae bacterium RIFOXYB12_FULL_65_16]
MNTEIAARIAELKERRHAVILAHNYQLPEVQDIADFSGDSLELSRKATTVDADVIVFCGVHFMAETAAILNPGRIVLIPDPLAGCPMADMITAEELRRKKQEHPNALVVCYVNSTAEVKAECDICCTSGNAIQVVASLPADRDILFVPDRYLGEHVSRLTGREMILWHGYCPTHAQIVPDDIARRRTEHPQAVVLVHPECTGPVRAAADEILSTGGMCRFARESTATEFIIGTETGILHRLQKDNPAKRFYPVKTSAVCPNMKKINLEKVLWALQEMRHEVRVPEPVRERARASIERMLQVKV